VLVDGGVRRGSDIVKAVALTFLVWQRSYAISMLDHLFCRDLDGTRRKVRLRDLRN
jgi:hypothetical protein